MRIPRLTPKKPLTPTEEVVAALIAHEYTYAQIGAFLGMETGTVSQHALTVASKLPGSLPSGARITFWYRGATRGQLDGSDIRKELEAAKELPRLGEPVDPPSVGMAEVVQTVQTYSVRGTPQPVTGADSDAG